MSTISDALKKAQNQRLVDPPVAKPPPLNNTAKPPPLNNAVKRIERSGDGSSGKAYPLFGILAVTLGLLLAVHFWTSRKNGLPSGESGSVAVVPSVPVAVVLPPAARPESAPQSLPSGVITQRVEEIGGGPRRAGVKVAESVAETQAVTPVVPPEAIPHRSPQAAPTLSAIFYSPKNPLAIINGESVMIGESVGGWKVLEILEESVRLQGDSGESVVKLK